MRVYQNKLLPYKAEQLLLAGFATPSFYPLIRCAGFEFKTVPFCWLCMK